MNKFCICNGSGIRPDPDNKCMIPALCECSLIATESQRERNRTLLFVSHKPGSVYELIQDCISCYINKSNYRNPKFDDMFKYYGNLDKIKKYLETQTKPGIPITITIRKLVTSSHMNTALRNGFKEILEWGANHGILPEYDVVFEMLIIKARTTPESMEKCKKFMPYKTYPRIYDEEPLCDGCPEIADCDDLTLAVDIYPQYCNQDDRNILTSLYLSKIVDFNPLCRVQYKISLNSLDWFYAKSSVINIKTDDLSGRMVGYGSYNEKFYIRQCNPKNITLDDILNIPELRNLANYITICNNGTCYVNQQVILGTYFTHSCHSFKYSNLVLILSTWFREDDIESRNESFNPSYPVSDGGSAISIAVSLGHEDLAISLIENDVTVKYTIEDYSVNIPAYGYPLLVYACKHKMSKLALYLLDHPLFVKHINYYENIVIWLAINHLVVVDRKIHELCLSNEFTFDKLQQHEIYVGYDNKLSLLKTHFTVFNDDKTINTNWLNRIEQKIKNTFDERDFSYILSNYGQPVSGTRGSKAQRIVYYLSKNKHVNVFRKKYIKSDETATEDRFALNSKTRIELRRICKEYGTFSTGTKHKLINCIEWYEKYLEHEQNYLNEVVWGGNPPVQPEELTVVESQCDAPVLTRHELIKLTIPKLKKILKDKGAKVSGLKAKLIERILICQ
ncbi:MAG: SAP domain-containing protein [Colwellia sp.]|nr:SAP domain-containing protein [Colwellia sp.]